MINFIKQAVESVEGIKSFLFNTDYRNNFDLQNVEFPCCVLTPIMNKKYDLNNIIRESAELQLSVVDLAPYEYTGDDLYAINKRCSDLALQVISNLQVKSKLDKELTFEFILPSGDELISGVMCNLQCTMKQGSCNGAPSYVEVIVQPIKRESITSNGKHVITPSKGFNAMREVEVDVQIGDITLEEKIVDITSNGEVEILPTSADAMTKVTANVQVPPPPLEEKQVTITSNGVTEIVPTSEYGLSRVEVVADVALNLQDKSITITENGMTDVTADEGFDGLGKVSVNSDVDTLQGLDFSLIYDQEQADEINQYYKDGIEYAKQIKKENPNISGNWDNRFRGDFRLKIFPKLALSKVTSFHQTFMNCNRLVEVSEIDCSSSTSLNRTFASCFPLRKLSLVNTGKSTTFEYCCYRCTCLTELFISDISNSISFTNLFYYNFSLSTAKLGKWKMGNISATDAVGLKADSIHYIIQNAISIADGATARTLTLNATAKTNWRNGEYYEQDLAVLTDKGITIA